MRPDDNVSVLEELRVAQLAWDEFAAAHAVVTLENAEAIHLLVRLRAALTAYRALPLPA